MVNICVVSAGAIGCFVGCVLNTQPGCNVSLIGRSKLIGEYEKTNCISARFLSKQVRSGPIDIKTSIEDGVKNADIILVAVKSIATAEVAKSIGAALTTSKTPKIVISLQNGVDNVDILEEHIVSPNQVYRAVVVFNVVRKPNLVFEQGTSGDLVVESLKPNSTSELSDIFNCFKDICESSFSGNEQIVFLSEKDIKNYQYTKLLFNLFNPINALGGMPIVDMLQVRNVRVIYAQAISEGIKACVKEGIVLAKLNVNIHFYPTLLRLPNWIFNIILKLKMKLSKEGKTSMLQDLEGNNKTEIDALCGPFIRLGKKHNINTPVLVKLYELVKQAENNGNGSPKLELSKFEQNFK